MHNNSLFKKLIYYWKLSLAMACGLVHTITLSDDGTVYSFGRNEEGALGLGHNNDVSLPTPIPNLPKIKMISCGANFTVCVDDEGFIWSFGNNNHGQLGTGNKINTNVPQKLEDIPPVLSVSCGSHHTLMITNDDNLWSCGRNQYGQLCHGNQDGQLKPQQTSFSNISQISAGCYHSLFGNDKGEIFSCGYNEQGQCGLGHFNSPQITPSLVLNVPSNIGSLGLGHKTNQNELNKIPNIPSIKIISCVGVSCYLIDFEGNLWSFGRNEEGQPW